MARQDCSSEEDDIGESSSVWCIFAVPSGYGSFRQGGGGAPPPPPLPPLPPPLKQRPGVGVAIKAPEGEELPGPSIGHGESRPFFSKCFKMVQKTLGGGGGGGGALWQQNLP